MILSLSSQYFDTAFNSKFQEGVHSEFKFEEDSPHALWRTFYYVYTGEYLDETDPILNEGMILTSCLLTYLCSDRRR